ncbi:tetratricopeptide repeat protein [Candidatus Micrarchaeota archaeon]|nr:tetratricopeptide repeat protein [Candidatus Micrarchaeota archaeon]
MYDSGKTLVLNSKQSLDNDNTGVAQKYIEELLILYPNYSISHFLKGRLCYKLGQTSAAIESLNKAISLDPESTEAHAYLGYSYVASGAFNDAFNALGKSLELNSQNVTARCTLAFVSNIIKKEDEAKEHLKKALLIDPTETMNWFHQFFNIIVLPTSQVNSQTKLQIKRGIEELQKLADAIKKQNQRT